MVPSFGLLEMHGLHRFDLVGLSQARGVLEQFLRTHLYVFQGRLQVDSTTLETVKTYLPKYHGLLRVRVPTCSQSHTSGELLVAFPPFHRLAVTYMRSTYSLRSDTAADKLEMHGPRGDDKKTAARRRFPAREAFAMLSHLGSASD